MKRYSMALAASLCLVSSPTWALTVSFTDTVPLSDVEIDGTLAVNQFDASLGTLTGVTWEITGAVAGTVSLTNTGSTLVTGTAATSVEFDLSSSALTLPDLTVTAETGDVSIGSGETETTTVAASGTVSGSEAPSDAFLGDGFVEVDYLTETGFSASGLGSSFAVGQDAEAGVSLTVTYEYDEIPAVPLPASSAALLLSLFGLAGIAWLRHRTTVTEDDDT